MPLAPVYQLTSVQVPVMPYFNTKDIDPAGAIQGKMYPSGIREFIMTAEQQTGLDKLNRNAARDEAEGVYGSGGGLSGGVVKGLDLVDTGGLTFKVQAAAAPGPDGLYYGVALIGGPVVLVGDILAQVLNDNGNNFVWLSWIKQLTIKLNDLTPPVDPSVYLGCIVTAGGVSTRVDYSGRQTMIDGIKYRHVADAGAPVDVPNANLRFMTETPAGLYFWTGVRHLSLVATTGNKYIINVGEAVALPAGYQELIFGKFVNNGTLVNNGQIRTMV